MASSTDVTKLLNQTEVAYAFKVFSSQKSKPEVTTLLDPMLIPAAS